jgi:hypothetical protein
LTKALGCVGVNSEKEGDMIEGNIVSYIFQALKFTVFWIIVPAIMIILIIVEKKIAENLENPKNQLSARAGWWAGLILAVFYIVSQFPSYTAPSLLFDISMKTSILGGLCGIVIGFVHLWVFKILNSSRAIGILTLLFTLIGSVFLISYFFLRTNNDFIFSAILGLALGEFLHVVIFPEDFEELYFHKTLLFKKRDPLLKTDSKEIDEKEIEAEQTK